MPHAAGRAGPGVRANRPSVAVGEDADRPGVRCPDREVYALDAVILGGVGAQLSVDLIIGPFMEQVAVELGEAGIQIVFRFPRAGLLVSFLTRL